MKWLYRALVAAAVAVCTLSPAAGAFGWQSALSLGQQVVGKGSVHHGDIDLTAGQVVVYGRENGSVQVAFGQVEIAGTVTGGVRVGTGQVVLAHGARVIGPVSIGTGQIVHLRPGESLQAYGASHSQPVSSSTTTTVANLPGLTPRLSLPFAAFAWPFGAVLGVVGWAFARLAWWLVSLAAAFLILTMFPDATRRITDEVATRPGPSLGWGVLLYLCAGPAAVLLAITILGAPLVMVLGLALVAAHVMGYIAVSLVLGARVLPALGMPGRTPVWELAAGTVALLVVGSVPWIGIPLTMAVACVGAGAVALTGFGTGRPWFRGPAPVPPA